MHVTLKYVILYVGAGVATGVFSRGDKVVGWIGLGLAALLGARFGVLYAALSVVEFAIGLGIAALVRRAARSRDTG